MTALQPALDVALAAAREAGALLRAELLRPGGPRGPLGHCPADTEAERVIRDRLLEATPDWAFWGEETGQQGDSDHVWVVDPNDGTSAMQRGGRGASVSIALLRDQQPVLGVVFAYAPPLGGAELYAWAEGCGPLTLNGRPVERAWPGEIGPQHTILVSQAADRRAAANVAFVRPARPRAVVSLAYRMALVAVGQGEVATSFGGPVGHDFAAGHALIRGAGGVVLGADGRPVVYGRDGASDPGGRLFAGHPAFAAALARRPAGGLLSGRDPLDPPDLVAASVDDRLADDALLDRARGCLLGQLAGDDLGATVEFSSAADVSAAYPGGVRILADGGHWNTLAGQPTDDSELALALARCLAQEGRFDAESVAAAYARWYDSEPFDIGGTTGKALGAASRAIRARTSPAAAARSAASPDSQANGALMRVSPLAVFGHALSPQVLAELARHDALLSHPHPVCQAASAVFCVAVAAAVRDGLSAEQTWAVALRQAEEEGETDILEIVRASAEGPVAKADGRHQGWVRFALHNALYQLRTAPSVEEGLAQTTLLGGDTDTNAAIAGALLGAVHGARSLPAQWVDRVLTCRPIAEAGARWPRPRWCWPVDALLLAERLVVQGRRAASSAKG